MEFEDNNFVIINKDDVIHPEETSLSKTGDELFKNTKENYYFKEQNYIPSEINLKDNKEEKGAVIKAPVKTKDEAALKSISSTMSSLPAVAVTLVASVTVLGSAAGLISIKPIDHKVSNFLTSSTELGFELEKDNETPYKMLLTNEALQYERDITSSHQFYFDELEPSTVYELALYDTNVEPNKLVYASSYMTSARDNYSAIITNTHITDEYITFDIAYEGDNFEFVSIDILDENNNVVYHYEGARVSQVKISRSSGTNYTCKVSINGTVIHLEELVNEEVVVPVTGVSLNKTSLELKVGDKDNLVATVLPDNASNKDIVFSSSKPEVVTINENGEVTALKKGNASIKVTTVDGGYIATCRVKVADAIVPVTGVSISEGSIELNVSETKSLSVTVLPSNATNKGVTFTSSNLNIATVDENGLITAISEGQTTIIVTTDEGGYQDFATVVVSSN